MKKMIMVVAILCAIAAAVVFYIALFNKTKDVSKKTPYMDLLNKEFRTVTEMLLVENTSFRSVNEHYPKEASTAAEIDTARIQYIQLPVGSTILFTKALHYTNATSGSKIAVLLGKVKLINKEEAFNVVYTWGRFKTICIGEPCNYWEYRHGFWEKK